MKVSEVKLSRPFKLLWNSDLGFGEFTFYEKDGKIVCDNEAMFRSSVKDVLDYLIENCELQDGFDSE